MSEFTKENRNVVSQSIFGHLEIARPKSRWSKLTVIEVRMWKMETKPILKTQYTNVGKTKVSLTLTFVLECEKIWPQKWGKCDGVFQIHSLKPCKNRFPDWF